MKIKHLIAGLLLSLPGGLFAQVSAVTLSGNVEDGTSHEQLPFVNVVLKTAGDSSFVSGTITDEAGEFRLVNVSPGDYILRFSFAGYTTRYQPYFVGATSDYLSIGTISLSADTQELDEVVVSAKKDEITGTLDKKTYEVSDNISQTGGSIAEVMKNLPGVTVEDGVVKIRGNANVIVLIDGKQSALTGFGNQTALANMPASAIERIEIINNPSSKYEANGSAGIINIILKKEDQNGFNGTVGITGGLGALWVKKENLPSIRPQYQRTPKIGPSFSLNYRKDKVNLFLQTDYLYTQTLNKNEFVTRTYDDGTVINQQTKRNRNTGFLTSKLGMDLNINDRNSFTVSALYGREKILDNGDEPFFNSDFSQRLRLWKFLEDELKTTLVGSAVFTHKYQQPGHQLVVGANYTFHRENEQYFFENSYPTYTGLDTFKLISDENVIDFNLDYVKPLKYGRFESGVKFRDRFIPTNMQFIPGLNSQMDSLAGGKAKYQELIPAVYGNYFYQNRKFDAEVGVRVEYVQVDYFVNPNHPTYKSDGYTYIQPFPNVRMGYRLNERNKLTFAMNRRVSRPNEVDIRIFPKYDDAEIIKVGNPALSPQYTNVAELGYKRNFKNGYFYGAFYGQITKGTITRIAAIVPGNTTIYNVFQNAGKSSNSGVELVFSKDLAKWITLSVNGNGYYNQIDAFTVVNKYPVTDTLSFSSQHTYTGNAKMNALIHLKKKLDFQLTAIYFAPDIIPQGRVGERFSLDFGLQQTIQKGKGQLFVNATDVLNTMIVRQQIMGDGFVYTSNNYNETQVVRVGYKYRF